MTDPDPDADGEPSTDVTGAVPSPLAGVTVIDQSKPRMPAVATIAVSLDRQYETNVSCESARQASSSVAASLAEPSVSSADAPSAKASDSGASVSAVSSPQAVATRANTSPIASR